MDVMHITHKHRKGPISLAITLICCVKLLEIQVNMTVQNAFHFGDTKRMEANLFLYYQYFSSWQSSPKLRPNLFISIVQHFQ